MVFVLGAVSMVGYVIGQATLYTWAEGVAMAFPTAMGFMCAGAAQYFLTRVCDRRR
jgi:hypothetical protein